MPKSGSLLLLLLILGQPARAEELFGKQPDAELIAAIRTIVAKDPQAALITVDSNGQPRVRTVDVRPLDDDLIFWIATRPGTRKVEQIRDHPEVALYFNVDSESSYVSVMGLAKLHDDRATKDAMTWRPEERRKRFWPDYPDDYLLIEVRPRWIEVLGEGVESHPETWIPQALVTETP